MVLRHLTLSISLNVRLSKTFHKLRCAHANPTGESKLARLATASWWCFLTRGMVWVVCIITVLQLIYMIVLWLPFVFGCCCCCCCCFCFFSGELSMVGHDQGWLEGARIGWAMSHRKNWTAKSSSFEDRFLKPDMQSHFVQWMIIEPFKSFLSEFHPIDPGHGKDRQSL